MDKALTEGYSVKLTLKTINTQEFMSLAIQACRQMGWRLAGTSEEGALLYTNGSAISLEEEITIHTFEDKAVITSRGVSEYLYNQEQNIHNILAFRSALSIHHNNYLQRKYPASKSLPTPIPELHFDIRAGWGAIIPSKRYLVTPILVYLNVLILLLMAMAGLSPIDPTASSLLGWGGNFRPLVLDGQYWRLFTYMFLHGGMAHLAGNVFALLYAGLYLEPILGKLRYISAYLITGVFAGLMSMVVHGYSVGVGASGAIFGLYGVFLALLTTNYIKGTIRTTLVRSLLFFIVYSLMMGLQGNTDNAAHIGGLLSGMAIGYAFMPGLEKKHSITMRSLVISAITISLAIMVACVVIYLKQVAG